MRTISNFPSNRDFSSLSVRDLIEARDHYHLHLAHKANVVATAIGRYLIRKGDYYDKHEPKPGDEAKAAAWEKPKGERTLFNTVVKPWSWPCVLVFVRKWDEQERIATSSGSDQVVPRYLYMPDGRVVPTCVVTMETQATPMAEPFELVFPPHYVGGGYPVFAKVQERDHVGSVACLVTDGNLTYALTNRHVTGPHGREIHTLLAGEDVVIGTSDRNQLAKKPFEEVYRGYPGKMVYANLDAGLIEIADVNRWTTQVRALGKLEAPIDLNPDTLTLDLVDCPVRAYGAASGELYGTIAGFFYRYKSMGGFDYVADLIIAPHKLGNGKATNPRPGDSGTLWCLELQKEDHVQLRPIAMQWGGVVVENAPEESPQSFTLATALSTVLRELDVDVVRGWNEGLPEYWGAVGHYTIAEKACFALEDQELGQLMRSNLDRITYPEARITRKTGTGLSKESFVPLADVADYVWKPPSINKKKNPYRRADENGNHFADMDKKVDQPGHPWHGKTLLDLCADEDNVDLDVWQEYYALVKDGSKGTIPFRVWQIFNQMVRSVRAKDLPRFIAAAGIIAHYIGDACQPLHISHMFDGEPAAKGEKRRGEGVHHAYEAVMLNSHVPLILGQVQGVVENEGRWPVPINSGRDAALQTVALMRETFRILRPARIVDAYADGDDLWSKFREPTVKTIANGVRLLARVWDDAWRLGGGKLPEGSLAIAQQALIDLYRDPDFLPSRRIADFAPLLNSSVIVGSGKRLSVKKREKAPVSAPRKRTRDQPRR